ncbi:hypothetical protein CP970_38930 [Streptomyces kanamyceticus]|uniref:Uncharacterized protein n=1 Tax=Streptomyces kanamyceticus TaxID=1967 RepID=A0A5J6GP13_STRKN|nr:hypothetical protein CP970_38930 [Streptomyces kanamyceticus]
MSLLYVKVAAAEVDTQHSGTGRVCLTRSAVDGWRGPVYVLQIWILCRSTDVASGGDAAARAGTSSCGRGGAGADLGACGPDWSGLRAGAPPGAPGCPS